MLVGIEMKDVLEEVPEVSAVGAVAVDAVEVRGRDAGAAEARPPRDDRHRISTLGGPTYALQTS